MKTYKFLSVCVIYLIVVGKKLTILSFILIHLHYWKHTLIENVAQQLPEWTAVFKWELISDIYSI